MNENPLDLMLMIGAGFTILSLLIGAVIWMVRLESKADSAVREHKDLQDKALPELKKRLDDLERHRNDIATLTAGLSAQMSMVLASIEDLKRDMRRLIDRELEK